MFSASNRSAAADPNAMSEYTIVDIQQVIAGDALTVATPASSAQLLNVGAKSTGGGDKQQQLTTLMNTSNITLDDSTPSDSGVQLLDSESSMNESLMSGSGLEFDLTPSSCAPTAVASTASAIDSVLSSPTMMTTTTVSQVDVLQPLDVDVANSNFVSPAQIATEPLTSMSAQADEMMKTSVCSTFDAEPIVYRRKTKKSRQHSASGGGSASAAGPKKRVSFHEDILNSTKTDNIHIEHGFITYKGGPARNKHPLAGRYSWCGTADASGTEGAGRGGQQRHADSGDADDDDAYVENGQYYYRNACSDVLDYGKTDLYEKETLGVQYDRSGVFEYGPLPPTATTSAAANGNVSEDAQSGGAFYKCQCSSSNSSLLSDDSATSTDQANGNQSPQSAVAAAAAQRNYGQSKSNSCDCIGANQPLLLAHQSDDQLINDNCYYSEPNIERLDDRGDRNRNDRPTKSVWSKELKPKSSCLKTGGRRHYTGNAVIPEYDLRQQLKTFNVHRQKLVPDMGKNIFGSLKQIFTMPLPERGVPEGCEDLHAVFECVPEAEHCSPAHKMSASPQLQQQQSARAFLSKSFDGGLAKGVETKPKKYVHNVDEQLRHNTTKKVEGSPREATSVLGSSAGSDGRSAELTASNCSSSPTTGAASEKGQRPKKAQTSSTTSTPVNSPSSFRNKYIINCESTVFEHTGVSYEADQMPLLLLGAENTNRAKSPPSSSADTTLLPPVAPIPAAIAKPTSRFSMPVPFRKKLSNIIRSFREPDSGRPKSGQMMVGILPSPSDNTFKVQEDEIEQPEEFVPLSDEDAEPAQSLAPMQVEFTVAAPPQRAMRPTPIAVDAPPLQPVDDIVAASDGPAKAAASPKYDCIQYNVPMCMDTSYRSDFSMCSSSTASTPEVPPHRPATVTAAAVAQLHPRTAADAPATAGGGASPSRSRHLISPMRKKSLCTNRFERTRMSPDLFGGGHVGRSGGCDSIKRTLSDEFDDILTITTTTTTTNNNTNASAAESTVMSMVSCAASDATNTSAEPSLCDSELVIVDYPDQNEFRQHQQQQSKQPPAPPPSLMTTSTASSSKSSLINRFLRNVTQKKIADATIQKNTQLAQQVRSERKLCDSLYVRGVRPRNNDLIDDLNAEIALEMEMSGCAQPAAVVQAAAPAAVVDAKVSEFGLGVGEIAADLFAVRRLPIFRDDREVLMKVFKLYTGYSLEGHMTPVLVFLTDKTLYVTDLVRHRLFNKFVLPYTELDVILIGPHGNTVLLSNSARDMQQVLLAGGPYPADGLVSSLEMCARRGGSVLPAVGQLTLDHLAPLQQFVRENSSVAKNDPWIYYAVVSVPANLLSHDVEPLGPHIKGPLMFRHVPFNSVAQQWQAGYFLLKAGVLYMFNDAQHRIPSLVIGMYECKGARRAATSSRPHCFELMLKSGFMQLAAPDEYVASDWLQALVQAASGLFEMQERHKALGCTMVLTSNHLITLREDFTAPLRRVNAATTTMAPAAVSPRKLALDRSLRKLSAATPNDSLFNDTASNFSSSTARFSGSRRSSALSSPTRSDDGRSPRHSIGTNGATSEAPEKSTTSMSSIYGKNSGVEIKTCAALQEISSVRIPPQGDHWWCILEFSCQEVRENSDDMVVFFATNSDMRRFLTMLETLWQSKHDSVFPLSILADDDAVGSHCSDLFMDINKSWDSLISAALGYAQ